MDPSLDLLTRAPLLAALAFLGLYYVYSLISWRARARGLPLPPGPPRYPIIGSALSMPRSRQHIGFISLTAKYGDVMFFRAFGQPILVLGSAESIVEYLDKHSANTSDRKQAPSMTLAGLNWIFAFFPYGSLWKHYRRLFWQCFNADAIVDYRPAQRTITHKLLSKLLNSPSKLREHGRYASSSVLLRIAYGVDPCDEDDETIEAIEGGLEGARRFLDAGGFFIDAFPILRHYPAWLPGGGFMRKLAEYTKASMSLRDAPYKRYVKSVAHDEVQRCFIADILNSLETEGKSSVGETSEETARNLAGMVFIAASETIATLVEVVFVAMSLYPEVQKKAQAELDLVVGPDRLPEISDRSATVYINALVKECFRWLLHAPFGVPHATTADDEFRGYFIPAGTIILPNVWACMRDPEVYEDPEVFRPDRFIRDGKLDPSVRDPDAFVFGFGRRICPGRFFGLDALYLNVACALHVFNITPPVDENGAEIKIEPRMTDALAGYLEDIRCTIKSRGPWAEALIVAAQEAAT